MAVKVEVFTSPTCPYCPRALAVAKEVAKEHEGVKIIETSTMTSSGRKRAMQFSILSVPTVLITGPATQEPIGIRGVPSKSGLIKAIAIANGQEVFEEKKSLLDHVKGWFSN
ncbi:MAG: thioredoxin family protein [Candidatus Woesearchaeota archaeon]